MSCRDIHATNLFAFLIALVSVSGLVVATLVPQWRITHLITFNRNARNVTVYDGLWAKCVKQQGSTGCYLYDTEWYSRVDQLDLRVLQFALPFSLLFSSLSLLLCMCGMCKTACCSTKPDPAPSNGGNCLVNSAGCHLVAGMLLFVAGAIAMAPSVWFLYYTEVLNKRYDRLFANDFAAYVAIGCSGGLLLASLLFMMWYCMCKTLPSPFWPPLPAVSASLSTQPLVSNGYPSPVYAPQPLLPQGYTPVPVTEPQIFAPVPVTEPQVFALPQSYAPPLGYAQSVAPAPSTYRPAHCGSEAGFSQAYTTHSYAPSQAYGYGSQRYSRRSRLSTIEIDIPVLTQAN